jgi:hypothetical protein
MLRSDSQAGSVAFGVEWVERPNPLLLLTFARLLPSRLHRLAAVLELGEHYCLWRSYPS